MRDDAIGLVGFDEERLAVGAEHQQAAEPRLHQRGHRVAKDALVERILGEGRGQGWKDAAEHGSLSYTALHARGVLHRRTHRFTPSVTRAMATAGASSQGAWRSTKGWAASTSIVPHDGVGSEKPRPTNDSVASARMNAGTSRSACVTMTGHGGRQAGAGGVIHAGVAPAASAASTDSRVAFDGGHGPYGPRDDGPARQREHQRHQRKSVRERQRQRQRRPQHQHDVQRRPGDEEVGEAHQRTCRASRRGRRPAGRRSAPTETAPARPASVRPSEQPRAVQQPRPLIAPERVAAERQQRFGGIGAAHQRAGEPGQGQAFVEDAIGRRQAFDEHAPGDRRRRQRQVGVLGRRRRSWRATARRGSASADDGKERARPGGARRSRRHRQRQPRAGRQRPRSAGPSTTARRRPPRSTRPTMRATVAAQPAARFEVARHAARRRSAGRDRCALSRVRWPVRHSAAVRRSCPTRPRTAGSDSGQAWRQVMTRRGTPRARAASRQRSPCTAVHGPRLQAFDQRRGRQRQRDHHHGERRQAGAGGDDGEQQRHDQCRHRQQQDGDCGDAVAHAAGARAAGEDAGGDAEQQRQQQRRAAGLQRGRRCAGRPVSAPAGRSAARCPRSSTRQAARRVARRIGSGSVEPERARAARPRAMRTAPVVQRRRRARGSVST